jgi:hypothetical protein
MNGGCFCSFIRYETGGEHSNETNCHCTICRRTSGAPFVAWFTVSCDDFRFVSGSPATFSSSDHGTRSFCPKCGTPLTFRSDRSPGEVDVTICSLDEPEEARPKDHTWSGSKLSWVELADRLPRFPEERF